MGIVPIWGFQMLAAIAIAILFKLNKAIVIIAANISIPPMIPFIIFASHWCGKFWMGQRSVTLNFSKELSMEAVQTSLVQYLAGSMTLATIGGLTFGIICYILLKTFPRKRSDKIV
jgi:uncharacterized protein (DUF2062 family)